MRFHWLRLRATCHPTEDLSKVKQALRTVSALPPDMLEERLETSTLTTHHGAQQHMLEVAITRAREVRDCLDTLLAGPVRQIVAGTLDERLDDDGVLYLRADKQRACQGQVVVGRFDDPVSVRVKNEVHPFSRDASMAAWQAWLAEGP